MDKTRYLEDLKVIREVLRENEERPLLEWWAFLLWGVLVVGGTLATPFLLESGLTVMESFLYLWVPIMILGAAGEFTALLRKFNREETPLFTRRYIKLFATFTLTFVALTAIVIPLIAEGIAPGTILVVASVPAIFYAYATFSSLFVEASILLVVGIFLEFLGVREPWLYISVGITVGVVYLTMGFHSRAAEGRNGG